MSTMTGAFVSVTIIPTQQSTPAGKLADAEVIFERDAGPFSGLKLRGFGVWERRNGQGRNVTLPARQYVADGQRRTFTLLCAANGGHGAEDAIKQCILDAYERFETHA